MALALSPIKETKSNNSVVNTPTSGKLLPQISLHLICYLSRTCR